MVRLKKDQQEMGLELTQSKRWDDLKRDICDHAMEYLRRVNHRARALDISLRRPANQAKLAITQRPKAPDSLRGEGCYMDSLQQARHAGRPIWECFKPISKPDGSPGPPSHRHADDTTPARANSRGYCLLARCGGTEHESWMSYRFPLYGGKSGRLGLACLAVVMAIYHSPPHHTACQESQGPQRNHRVQRTPLLPGFGVIHQCWQECGYATRRGSRGPIGDGPSDRRDF